MSENILTIETYFHKGKFVIPNYQRGYKWGVPNSNGDCAVSVLMDNLIKAYENSSNEYFIQGVTVCESGDNGGKKEITLIDGQQRTTTFYLLLKYLSHDELPEIEYSIRKESDYVLKNSTIKESDYVPKNSTIKKYCLKFNPEEGKEANDYEFQDIDYFKKAIETIDSKLSDSKIVGNEKTKKFREWILTSVKLFYITINPEEATKVFSMMNGQKAVMKTDELIKSALLSKASRSNPLKNEAKENSKKFDKSQHNIAKEWEINSLRSKYAREWDKWLYWWNRPDVKNFFSSEGNPLGLLLEYYFELNKKKEDVKEYSYKSFNECFFEGEAKNAKIHYKSIRDLQKTFEDWFNNYATYNYLGLILRSGSDKKQAILYLLKHNTIKAMEEYAKWTLVGANYKQIVNENELQENEETKEDKAELAYERLSQQVVYGNEGHGDALKQLLRRNVKLDNDLKRKFDFALYGAKSLEHIYPQSKENELNFEEKDKLSVHSIGNLVLIKNNENSMLGAKSFEEKKDIYFDMGNAKWSLKFLHSVSAYSKNKWNEKNIKNNQNEFLDNFKNHYNIENRENDEQ